MFAAFTAWERQSDWIPFTRVRVVEGDGGEGSLIEAVTAVGPAVLRDEMRVVRLDPPYEVRVVHCGKLLRGPGVLRCTPMERRPHPGGLARVVPPARRRGRPGRLAGAVAGLQGEPDPGAEAVRPAGRGRSAAVAVDVRRAGAVDRCDATGWPAAAGARSTPEYIAYHDGEWGRPVRDDDALFEKITLEAFQSGLSWLTILRKRPAFRAAFDGFAIEKVAGYGEADVARLLADAGIVRNRAKIEAAIANARAAAELPDGLAALLWSFAPAPARRPPGRLRRGAGDHRRVDRDGQGAEEARVPVRRADHGVRADAGHRHGRRPPRRLPRRRHDEMGPWRSGRWCIACGAVTRPSGCSTTTPLSSSDPPAAGARPVPGDEVLVVARRAGACRGGAWAGSPGRRDTDGEPLVVAYTRRFFDDPQPAERAGARRRAEPGRRRRPSRRWPGAWRRRRDQRTWLVSVDLPIEADSPAEAVRLFWSYVRELGPRELPAFVSPTGDELAMQAFVLGEQANLDPEEDDDD